MAHGFNGSTSEINLGTTSYNAWSGLTMAFLWRADTASAYSTLYNSRNSGVTQLSVGFDSANRPYCMVGNNNELFVNAFTISASTWYLWIIDKATGTVAPRLHHYNGTTWSHANYDVARPDPTTTITLNCIGAYNSNVDRLDGQIAYIGIWSGQISGAADADHEAFGWDDLSNWQSFANTRQFYTESLDEASLGSPVVNDLASPNNDSTSSTGITAAEQTIPAWFTTGGAPPPTPTLWVPNVRKNHLGLLTGRP